MSVTSKNKIPSLGLAIDTPADTSMPSFPCHWGLGSQVKRSPGLELPDLANTGSPVKFE